MKKNTKKFYTKNKGFTLVEMLIAVLIFTLSLTALMTISARGLKASKGAEKQVVADYLAIEAVEVVRNLRDAAFLKNLGLTTWEMVFTGGSDIFAPDEGCFDGPGVCNFFIPPGGDPILDNCAHECPVWVDNNRIFYFQTQNDSIPGVVNGVDSGFTRTIKINQVSPGQVIVLVVVKWSEGEVIYTENLFLWQ